MPARSTKGIFRASADPEGNAGSPSATPAPADKPTGTTRKCANCGQAGHIKTNKKYCNHNLDNYFIIKSPLPPYLPSPIAELFYNTFTDRCTFATL